MYWESASISALRDAQGRITHYLAVKEDITERKRLEQEVESRNRELARAQALAEVGRMATMIAHDLRNPLSSVKIALQVLRKQDAPDGESRELRVIAREQVACMEEILSDMLTYARPRTPNLEWLHVDRLFEPFFTTRAKGTGLGLAIVRRILDAHDADIGLDPHRPRGTCCRVLLPTVPRQTETSLTGMKTEAPTASAAVAPP